MTGYQNWSKWLKKHDTKQCEWCWGYLLNKNLTQNQYLIPGHYEAIVQIIDTWNNDANHREIMRNMKNAWAKAVTRKSPDGKNTCSFELTTNVKRSLKWLADKNKTTQSETVKLLIEDNYNYAKQVKAETDIKIKAMRAKVPLSKIRVRKCSETHLEQSTEKEHERVVLELEEIKKELEHVKNTANNDLRMLCQFREQLKGAGMISKKLTHKQRAAAEKEFRNKQF